MRIRILRACVIGRASLNPGSVVNLDDRLALDMIDHGIATRIDLIVTEEVETETANPPKRKPRRHKCGMQ